jgi:DNA-binding transcriptional ArsR family regulator
MSAARAVAPVFAALGDETRLRLVGRLSAGKPESIARLCEGSRLTRQAITKHLTVLSRAGLVRDRRIGRERVWSLQGRKLAEVREYLDRVSAQWDDALVRLKDFVEG